MRFGLLLSSLLGLDGGPIGMDGALTTANVPAKFLGDVYFVEHVPLMALQVDPRISFALYVPESHYNPDPNSEGSNGEKLPLLVYVHGTGRSIVAIYDELVPFANSTPCAILAPLFPAGMDGPNDIDSYKELRSQSLRSDLGLLSVLDQVAYRWPGIETEKVAMMGFSGGGQFVQRFLYLYPERLAVASIGSPGRPTYLDDTQDWPVGTADVEDVFNRTISSQSIGDVTLQLVVGNKDTELHGDDDFWEWEQEVLGGGGLPPMNETRLESVQKLHTSWEQAGITSQLDIVDGVAHNETGVRETVLKFLQPWIQKMA
ncbi:alpha/beta-hydrolase [Hypoxylon rubiginosum]|uniref:Alpha/beta-hydrolase n=1 Tax=Hypoxylon rubiginosum TaxID=110542 RepID=A0ACC0D2R6_9PEZI|nr:alpha/beta-hydrolase [Hypoxylon rubiginosum]